ncbi:MAG: hypothetical protein ABIV36_01040 [Sphingobium limneticum]
MAIIAPAACPVLAMMLQSARGMSLMLKRVLSTHGETDRPRTIVKISGLSGAMYALLTLGE